MRGSQAWRPLPRTSKFRSPARTIGIAAKIRVRSRRTATTTSGSNVPGEPRTPHCQAMPPSYLPKHIRSLRIAPGPKIARSMLVSHNCRFLALSAGAQLRGVRKNRKARPPPANRGKQDRPGARQLQPRARALRECADNAYVEPLSGATSAAGRPS